MPDDPLDPLETFRLMLDAARRQSSPYARSKSRAEELASTLSASEKRILSQIVAGWSSGDIAADHGVDMDTFEAQRTRLFRKISAGSTSEAVRIGIYAGLG